jgi:hypothetical protein
MDLQEVVMRLVRRMIVGAALTVYTTSTIGAQAGAEAAAWPVQGGFVGSLSFGMGSGAVSMNAPGRPDIGVANVGYTVADVSYELFLGVAVTPRVRVGAQVDVMNHSAPGTPDGPPGNLERSIFYTAAVAVYPFSSSSFWARANLGFGSLRVQSYAAGFVSTPYRPVTGNGTGPAAGLGVGYDWRPHGVGLLVIPYASYLVQSPQVGFDPVYGKGYAKSKLLQFGVGLGYIR